MQFFGGLDASTLTSSSQSHIEWNEKIKIVTLKNAYIAIEIGPNGTMYVMLGRILFLLLLREQTYHIHLLHLLLLLSPPHPSFSSSQDYHLHPNSTFWNPRLPDHTLPRHEPCVIPPQRVRISHPGLRVLPSMRPLSYPARRGHRRNPTL